LLRRKLRDYVGNIDLVNRIVFNVIGLPIIGLESKEVGIVVGAMRRRKTSGIFLGISMNPDQTLANHTWLSVIVGHVATGIGCLSDWRFGVSDLFS